MKKIFTTLCMALMAAAMVGQQPVITFEKTEHDFGKINEADGRVSTVFTFKNEGMAPLVLSNVRASCGCTTPTWTKEPIEPGQTGSITVTYNPNGRPGRFQKTITITSNATDAQKRVYIKGEVIPKQAKPANKYTTPVGALSMQTKELDLGTAIKGENKSGELEYTNLTQANHRVALAVSPADNYLINQITLEEVKPNEIGKFVFALNTKDAKVYGPVEAYVYVVVDGKKEISDDYRLTITADILEDFSQMTVEERQQAPIMETEATVDLGTISAGKVFKGQLSIKNGGMKPLEIRRVHCTDSNIMVKIPKAIKSGKRGAINFEINTKTLTAGSYSRELLIISNDFAHPRQKVTVNWTIE